MGSCGAVQTDKSHLLRVNHEFQSLNPTPSAGVTPQCLGLTWRIMGLSKKGEKYLNWGI